FELARELEQRLYADRLPGLLPFFERLASSGVPNACVLAAAAIRMPGSRAGWTPEWRELLRRLRDYPASEVSRLACGVYTSAECAARGGPRRAVGSAVSAARRERTSSVRCGWRP